MIKFCKNDDGRIAIGTGIRPIEHCRPCYVAAHEDEFQPWRVTDQVAKSDDLEGIACAKTGEVIDGGGTVWLDPVETNIPALVYAGFIEKTPDEKTTKLDKPTRDTGVTEPA